jgi:hypothetical protein
MPQSISEWSSRLNRASGDLRKFVATELVKTALRGEREAKLRVTNGGSTRLNVRTGRLRASIAGGVRIKTGGIDVRLTAGGRSPNPKQLSPNTAPAGEVRYARIHEKGGTIRARGKMLTIPISDKLFTAGGKQRYASARDVPDLVFIRSLKGAFLLVNKHTFEPFYVLKNQITIPARPYLAPGLRTAAVKMDTDIHRAIEKLLDFSTGGST